MDRPITELLDAHANGDEEALGRLTSVVYAELRRIAGRQLRGDQGNTLQPTALVHEAWVKLSQGLGEVNGREHFFAVASRAMRQVLASHARKLHAAKRGGGAQRQTLLELADGEGRQDIELLALSDSLERLATLNDRHARVVELRFLGGLTISETATALGVSTGTVEADWALARVWLFRELAQA